MENYKHLDRKSWKKCKCNWKGEFLCFIEGGRGSDRSRRFGHKL